VKRVRKVYVVNRSAHDFSSAESYGELIFMSEGKMNRFGTNDMIRQFGDAMRESEKDDYLLLCSLSVMNAIAAAVFARKHGTLNLLLYKDGRYVERNHVLDEF